MVRTTTADATDDEPTTEHVSVRSPDDVEPGDTVDVSGPDWLPKTALTVDEVGADWHDGKGTVITASLDRKNARDYTFRVRSERGTVETSDSAGRWGVHVTMNKVVDRYSEGDRVLVDHEEPGTKARPGTVRDVRDGQAGPVYIVDLDEGGDAHVSRHAIVDWDEPTPNFEGVEVRVSGTKGKVSSAHDRAYKVEVEMGGIVQNVVVTPDYAHSHVVDDD